MVDSKRKNIGKGDKCKKQLQTSNQFKKTKNKKIGFKHRINTNLS